METELLLRFTVLFFLIWTGISANIAFSAEISEKKEALSESRCSLEIHGPIQTGDFTKFQKALIKLGWFDPNDDIPPFDTRGRILCLNSSGGVFFDGIQISRLVRKSGIATYIPDGAVCFSACATIFMSGSTIMEEGGDGYHNRVLHVGGRLGFHAPYYTGKTFSGLNAKKTAKLFTIYRLFIAELIAQSRMLAPDSVFPATPMSLLEQLMDAGPKQIVEIDTIGEVGRWNITITGFRKIKWSRTKASYQQLCFNWSNWIFDKKSRIFAYDPDAPNISQIKIKLKKYDEYQRQKLKNLKIYRTYYWEYIPAYCDMAMLDEDTVFLSLTDKHRGVEFPWWTIPAYLALPPDTPLVALKQ